MKVFGNSYSGAEESADSPPSSDIRLATEWLSSHAVERSDGDLLVGSGPVQARALAALLAEVRSETFERAARMCDRAALELANDDDESGEDAADYCACVIRGLSRSALRTASGRQP